MTWPLTWHNVSAATLNATLYFFYFFFRSQIKDLGNLFQKTKLNEHHATLKGQYQLASHLAKLGPQHLS